MSKRISDYKLVRINHDDPTPLKTAIAEGWQPFHGPVPCMNNASLFEQAVVKYEEAAEPQTELDILIGDVIDIFRRDLLARRGEGWELQGSISAQETEPRFFAVVTRKQRPE